MEIKSPETAKYFWLEFVAKKCEEMVEKELNHKYDLVYVAREILALAYIINNCECKKCLGFGTINLKNCEKCNGTGKRYNE